MTGVSIHAKAAAAAAAAVVVVVVNIRAMKPTTTRGSTAAAPMGELHALTCFQGTTMH